MVTEWMPRAIISANAMARRIQRGADRSHGALLADLAVLAAAGDEGDYVATPDGGYWLGPMRRCAAPIG
jgi:hypothetical protein